MTLEDLKTILINHLDSGSVKKVSTNHEIVEYVMGAQGFDEIEPAEVFAFEVGGTTVLLSDSGLTKPSRIIFVDLKNQKSFLQELE